MRWKPAALAVLAAALLVSCMKHEPDPYFRITANDLDHGIPPGALAAQLSPAERAALGEQGYEIQVDEDDWAEQERLIAEGKLEEREETSGFQRAMDHAGKATVAFSSVAVAVGMVIAPFFLF